LGERILNLKFASEVLLAKPVPVPKVLPKNVTLPAETKSEVKPGEMPQVATQALSGTALADIKDLYKAELRARIEENKFYPMAARRLGHTGTVIVAFTLLEDGSIINVRIDSTSGSERLDSAGVEAVKKVGKFKAIPSELSTNALDMSVPIKFQTI
jgi:protein TonB